MTSTKIAINNDNCKRKKNGHEIIKYFALHPHKDLIYKSKMAKRELSNVVSTVNTGDLVKQVTRSDLQSKQRSMRPIIEPR